MSYVHVCQKCKAVFKYPTQEESSCPDCRVPMYSTGLTDAEWTRLTPQQRKDFGDIVFRRRREEELRQAQIKEEKKVDYTKSLKDYVFYEYDVVPIQNEGAVNVQLLKSILDSRAKSGWRLHTIYSNELGKNSHMEFNTRVNSTVTQDVLIFERRIMDDSQR